MSAHSSRSARPAWASPQGLWFELRLSWAFIAGDISSAVIPALFFSLTAWKVAGAVWSQLPGVLAASLLYFWLYLYMFCLSNQLDGVEEDRLNKPHRPLVTGMVDREGARVRLVGVMLLFALVGAWLGVLVYALMWHAVIIVHNLLVHPARHWVVKNASMSVGIVAQLGAAWQLVTPLTPVAWTWILFLATVILPMVSLQDLRDMEGDARVGRRTFPHRFGERFTRRFLCLVFAVLPLAVHFVLMRPLGSRPLVWLCDAVLALLSLTISLRVVRRRSQAEDHRTYLLLTYWYCALLASALLLLQAPAGA